MNEFIAATPRFFSPIPHGHLLDGGWLRLVERRLNLAPLTQILEKQMRMYEVLVEQMQRYNALFWQFPTALAALNFFAIPKLLQLPWILAGLAALNFVLLYAFARMIRTCNHRAPPLSMHPCMVTINLESDHPAVDEARRRLLVELQTATKAGVTVLKVIDGWGSSAGRRPRPPTRRRTHRGRFTGFYASAPIFRRE